MLEDVSSVENFISAYEDSRFLFVTCSLFPKATF